MKTRDAVDSNHSSPMNSSNIKNILVVAAENSAENYAAQIVREFKRKETPPYSFHFFGVGGDKLAAQDFDIIIHNRELSVVGIIEVISSLRKLKRVMNTLYSTALELKTDAVILIDYPDFNLRLAKKFKKAGIRVYYYISPTVWAWRYSRVKTIKKYVDHLFIIFPFEIPIYVKENIPFTYTGHPLLPMITVTQSRESFRQKLNVPKDEILLTLLPGSRKSEVTFLLPTMLETVRRLMNEYKIHLFLLKAHNLEPGLLEMFLKQSPVPVNVIEQENGYNLMNASDIILSTCGTSNLEIAMLGVPFTAVYRVNKLSYLLGRKFVKINLYSIVNILTGKEVIKEWIQHEYTAENVLGELKRILDNPSVREEMKTEFKRIHEQLIQPHHPPEIIYEKIYSDLTR